MNDADETLLDQLQRHNEELQEIYQRTEDAAHYQPLTDHVNPGMSSPMAEQRPRILVAQDQTQSKSSSSASHINSNGQAQVLDLDPGKRGVHVTHVPMMSVRKASDGSFQRKDLAPLDQGTHSSVGAPIAKDVHVGSQNLHRAPLAEAATTAPAKTVDASSWHPGGLAEQVSIK